MVLATFNEAAFSSYKTGLMSLSSRNNFGL